MSAMKLKPEEWKVKDLFIDLEQQFDFVDGQSANLYVILREFDDKEGCFRVCKVGTITIDGQFAYDFDAHTHLDGGEWWNASDSMDKVELKVGNTIVV